MNKTPKALCLWSFAYEIIEFIYNMKQIDKNRMSCRCMF